MQNLQNQRRSLPLIQKNHNLSATYSVDCPSRATIAQIAEENGLSTLPSATNFVAVDCGRDGAFAKALLDDLVANGLFVRMPFVAPQNRCIRVSAGHPEDLELLRDLLPKALSAALTR